MIGGDETESQMIKWKKKELLLSHANILGIELSMIDLH